MVMPEQVSGNVRGGSGVANPPETGICDTNRRIAALARRQGGHVTRTQLLGLGVQKRAVEGRLARGELIRAHHGVYAVGHLPTNPVDRAHGALLAAGRDSALADRSAAALWELLESWPQRLELVSPRRLRVPGLRVRRCGKLQRQDLRVHRGVRVTSPARTVLDIAPRTAFRRLDRFHNELRMRNLVSNDELVDVARRNPRHPGARILLELAEASSGEAKRSVFEVEWPRFARRYGLPKYEMNVHVAGARVDVLFTPDRLVVELDGWATHGTRQAYQRDRMQDAHILATSGIPTVRITRDAFKADPAAEAQRVLAVLARR
jgi:very-short-patch-repair endonuclease